MPRAPWTGYGRFFRLARALDVVGERWTLLVVQELFERPSRYTALARRLPGIGTTVLAERLRKLEAAGIVERRSGAVGEGVAYALTERGLALGDALEALRRWGVEFLADPAADGAACQTFDVRYVEGIESLDDGEFGLVVDGRASTLRFGDGAGLPFAPNGKVFREWIAFPVPDEEEWSALLDEARAFAGG